MWRSRLAGPDWMPWNTFLARNQRRRNQRDSADIPEDIEKEAPPNGTSLEDAETLDGHSDPVDTGSNDASNTSTLNGPNSPMHAKKIADLEHTNNANSDAKADEEDLRKLEKAYQPRKSTNDHSFSRSNSRVNGDDATGGFDGEPMRSKKSLESQPRKSVRISRDLPRAYGPLESSRTNLEPEVDDWEPTPISEGPPPLKYSLHGRKKSIALFWGLLILDTVFMPIILYFPLKYATHLSNNAVFSISTAALGGTGILEYFIRFWRLWKQGSTCRVIGGRRSHLDWFHWNYSIAWIAIMCELIIGTVFKNPPIRLLAMPVSSLCFWFAFQLILLDTLRIMGYRSHIRISSMPKGSPLRPGIYALIEDVVAVDGSGGTEFRIRFNRRYEASKDFRMMLHRLTLFWAFGLAATAILTTVLVFTVERDAAYVCGWTIPFIWAAVWAILTVPYVKRCLKREKLDWGRRKESLKILRV